MMSERRNIICKVRLNNEEFEQFKTKSERYGGNMSSMIRDAVSRFDDKKAKGKIDALEELLSFYKTYQQQLSWFGGNFNQSMKRANELAIGGELTHSYFTNVLAPQTKEAINFLREIKSKLDIIHDNLESL